MSFDSTTPRFGIQYQVDPKTMIYASYSKGFKSGGYDVTTVAHAFEPEKLTAYELGLKTTTNSANNSASDTDVRVTVAKSLFAENGAVTGQAEPGEQLTYQIALTNTESTNVTDFDLVDTLDSNSSFVSATNGGVHSGGAISWSDLSIAAGQTITLTVVVQVNASLPTDARNITNIVRIPGAPDPTCPSSQCVVTPLTPKVSYVKTSNAV